VSPDVPLATGSVEALVTAFGAVIVLLALIVVPFVIWGRRRSIPPIEGGGVPGSTSDEPAEVEPNVLALAVSVGAAFLGIVATFLPALESQTFSSIEQNALIQKGTGFFVVGVCLAILGDSYRTYQARSRSWGVTLGGVLLIAAAIYAATGSRVRLEGTAVLTGQTIVEKASPAIGIYAVGAAGAIAVFAGYAIATNRGALAAPETRKTKTCPDCAETVIAAARICKHCGHEFEPIAAQP
jgi:Uncharacterised protein family UPF0547